MARIVELILTDELIGRGTDNDPRRRALELWTKDGKLVARHDYVATELNLTGDREGVNLLNLGVLRG